MEHNSLNVHSYTFPVLGLIIKLLGETPAIILGLVSFLKAKQKLQKCARYLSRFPLQSSKI